MEEPRKIVLILGNGFDLDRGLKTSYKDFWESEYCPKKYPAPLIHHLNQCWHNNLDAVRWYDLENELLNYYNTLPEPKIGVDILTEEEILFLKGFDERIAVFGDEKRLQIAASLVNKGVLSTNGNLFGYLNNLFKDDALKPPSWRDRKALSIIKEGLCKYIKSLGLSTNDNNTIAFEVLSLLDVVAENGDIVDIYTFNYTQVQFRSRDISSAKVHYMHGSCEDGRIIIGTRDNKEYTTDYDFLQKSFDHNFYPPSLVEDLKYANEVVFFGHSIGENDRQYFSFFFKQQTADTKVDRKDITIFTRDNDSEIQIKRALQTMTDGNLSTLFSQNNVQIIKTKNIQEDQHRLLNFLLEHRGNELDSQRFIGDLLKRESSNYTKKHT